MTFHSKKNAQGRGATVAGLFGLALMSVLLLCGAGNVPVENFTPQGPMQADLNSGGHNMTNAATVSAMMVTAGTITASNMTVSGALTATNYTLPFARVTSTPTNVAGYGITDAYNKTQSDGRYDTNGAAAAAQAASQPLNTNLTAYASTGSAAIAASVPVTGLTGAGTGVTAALGNALDVAGGVASHANAVNASNLTSGTLPHAQLPALVPGDIPSNAANTTGSAGSVAVTGLTGTGKGVSSALAQPVDGASGVVVADANNKLPYDPHAANLDNITDVFEGDSITAGLGLTSPSTQGFPALFAGMNYASGHSTVYNVGVASALIPAGSNGGNNITDHYAANVYPHRPWATATSAAGTGTITGDGNVTLTGSGTAFTTQLAVGATIFFNGHLAKVATIPSNTQLTISATAIPNSTVVISLLGINPSASAFTFGGDGGPQSTLHLMIGTNDISGGSYTAAQVITNLTTYTNRALGDGFRVVLSTILPASRLGASLTSSLWGIYQTVNTAIRTQTVPSSMVADSATILNNATSSTYFQGDQLHPTAAGDALLAAYYNAGMAAGNFAVRPAEGSFEAPVQAPYFQPYPLANSAGMPVYYCYNSGGVTVGLGIDSGYLPEIFAGNNGGISFNNFGFQATSTNNRLMFLDNNGNLTVTGNLKQLTTQTNATQTLAVNSRTVCYSNTNVTFTLPATCAVGDTVSVTGGAPGVTGFFTITKATGQSIYLGSGTAYSSLTEQATGEAVQLTCTVANTSWTASSLVGTFTETP